MRQGDYVRLKPGSGWNSYIHKMKPGFTPSDMRGVIVSWRKDKYGCVRVRWRASHPADRIHVDFLEVI